MREEEKNSEKMELESENDLNYPNQTYRSKQLTAGSLSH